MPIVYPYTQYTGIWKLSAASAAQGAGTWPSPPVAAPHLFSWGNSSQGQLGLGNTTGYSSPKQVGSLTNWLQVSAASYFSAAIKSDGTLWTWGGNDLGQLGLGNTTYYSSPKQVGSLTNWSSVSTAYKFALAIKTDGTLWGWGRNYFGQTGINNRTNQSSPVQVGALTTWLKVSAGYDNGFAIKTDGTLWGWGYNGLGQVGLGNTTYLFSSPQQVGALTNWSSVSVGRYSVIATQSNGTLWAWGRNNYGQLANGTTNNYSSPIQIGALTNWSKLFCGADYSVAIKTDGTLWSWGSNGQGQLGLGNTTSYSSPKQVGSLTNWSSASVANFTDGVTTAIKTDGTLWSWGENNYGQLGLGNTTYYSSPKQVGSLTSWTKIAAGGRFMLGIAQTF